MQTVSTRKIASSNLAEGIVPKNIEQKGELKMLHIQKIKTMYGLKWAVVDTSFTLNKKGEKQFYTHAVEYQGSNYKQDVRDVKVAVFPLTQEGLEKAREIRKMLNNNK